MTRSVELPEHELKMRIGPGRLHGHIQRIANEVDNRYAGDDITLLAIYWGAKWFRRKLVDELRFGSIKPQIVRQDSMRVASYVEGGGMESNGQPQIIDYPNNPEQNIRRRKVIVVEDIIDTGLTMRDTVLPYVWSQGPESVQVVAMLTKFDRLKVGKNDLCLLTSGPNIDFFAVGSGLDWLGHYRDLPGIQEVILKK
jgi:hypoxanthine phosphoribosyltransferase